MILTDTGPIVALLDRRQSAHLRCVEVYRSELLPIVTTWPCFVKAMYLLGKLGSWRSQSLLWDFVQRIRFATSTVSGIFRRVHRIGRQAREWQGAQCSEKLRAKLTA